MLYRVSLGEARENAYRLSIKLRYRAEEGKAITNEICHLLIFDGSITGAQFMSGFMGHHRLP